MKYRVVHNTTYAYSEQAALSQNELCLFPRDTKGQHCLQKHLRVGPEPSTLDSRTDYFGNHVHHLMVKAPHRKLEIVTDSLLVTDPGEAAGGILSPAWEEAAKTIRRHATDEDLEALEFVLPSGFVVLSPEIRAYAAASFPPGRPTLEAALDLTARIHREFSYEKDATTVNTPLHEVLKIKKGVCQDFAHLEIACLRSMGLAARYVSGYLETLPPPGKPKLMGADASHAWLSIYIPSAGWVDLDPTNDMIPGERHITVAWGRDYGDVTPVKGIIWGGGTHELRVAVDVTPVT